MKSFLLRCCVVLLAFAAGHGHAGEFTISPVRLVLGGAARSQLLALTNTGDAPARFLVRAARWSLDENGAVQLADDADLLVFPATFTVAPGAVQNIRVGTPARAGESEQTWRVVLEELPNADAAPADGTRIKVLSVISVPVFLPPVATRRSLALAWLDANEVEARITARNEGNAHELLAAVRLTAWRGQQALQQLQQEGWYVLPGAQRVYGFKAEHPWCRLGADRFELRAVDSQGQALARQTVVAAEVCR